ncbi:DUF943 family protein [uncultured Pluralibacter sp.]|uniref:DUF943 family protein n=1 Tax=uncultured Pluralibacter sp. TaxID=1490864 RepID=UPI002630AF67|nr:DUF943 family protein [uncultured Pluralibacter sp.]
MRKYTSWIFILIILSTISYINIIRKPEIIFVSKELNFNNIIIKHFPLTQHGKIAWWKNNREKLKNKFNIPVMASNGDWYVDIWNYGNGFKKLPKGDVRIFNADTQDMMCFDKDKCIDKELLMRVENNRRGGIIISIGDNKIDEK